MTIGYRPTGRTTLVAVVLLTGLLSGCGTQGSRPKPASKSQAADPDFALTLQNGLAVSGTATFVSHTETNYLPNGTSTETWAEWSYDIGVANRTDGPLTLDSAVLLVETDTTDTEYEGYMVVNDKRVREPLLPPVIHRDKGEGKGAVEKTCIDHSIGYGLDDYEAFDGKTQRIDVGGFSGKFYFCSTDRTKLADWGALPKGGAIQLKRTIKPFSWLDGKHCESVCFVLPEVHRNKAGSFDSYQPLALMEKVGDLDHWKVGRLLILHETAADLEAALTSDKYGLFTKVLAANRLAEYYPERAGAAFASTAKGLRRGHLLACMIDLAARMNTDVLQEHCRDLASDPKAPKGITSRAKAYLKAIAAKREKAR